MLPVLREVVAAPVERRERELDAELARRGLHDAQSLGHHFLADAVARDHRDPVRCHAVPLRKTPSLRNLIRFGRCRRPVRDRAHRVPCGSRARRRIRRGEGDARAQLLDRRRRQATTSRWAWPAASRSSITARPVRSSACAPATASRSIRRARHTRTARRCRRSPPSAASAQGDVYQADVAADFKPFRRAVDYLPARDGADQAADRRPLVHPQQAALGRGVPLRRSCACRRRISRASPRRWAAISRATSPRSERGRLDVGAAPRYRRPPRNARESGPMGVMVMALFRPKAGKDGELMACMRDHLPVLRAQGLATDRPSTVLLRAGRHAGRDLRVAFARGHRRRARRSRGRQAVGTLRRVLRLRDARRSRRERARCSRSSSS